MAAAGLAFTFCAALSQNSTAFNILCSCFPLYYAGELCSCPAVLQRERHNTASDLADVAVHTDPPRELGSAHVEPLAGLALVGKHWWS